MCATLLVYIQPVQSHAHVHTPPGLGVGAGKALAPSEQRGKDNTPRDHHEPTAHRRTRSHRRPAAVVRLGADRNVRTLESASPKCRHAVGRRRGAVWKHAHCFAPQLSYTGIRYMYPRSATRDTAAWCKEPSVQEVQQSTRHIRGGRKERKRETMRCPEAKPFSGESLTRY